jgi:hypothetical protein
MQSISIETVAASNGDRLYRAAIGDRHSVGRTAGEALDALNIQMGIQEINGFLLLKSFQPDQFFTAQQQQRLIELMSLWRIARDRDENISPEQQLELDTLIEAELNATTERSKAILVQIQP